MWTQLQLSGKYSASVPYRPFLSRLSTYTFRSKSGLLYANDERVTFESHLKHGGRIRTDIKKNDINTLFLRSGKFKLVLLIFGIIFFMVGLVLTVIGVISYGGFLFIFPGIIILTIGLVMFILSFFKKNELIISYHTTSTSLGAIKIKKKGFSFYSDAVQFIEGYWELKENGNENWKV